MIYSTSQTTHTGTTMPIDCIETNLYKSLCFSLCEIRQMELRANSFPCTSSAGTSRPRVWTFCSCWGFYHRVRDGSLRPLPCSWCCACWKLLRTSPQAPQCWARRTRNMLDILVSGMLHFRGFSRPFSGVASTPYPIFFTNMGIFFKK